MRSGITPGTARKKIAEMETHELIPCPFCKGKAHLERKSKTVVQGVTVRHTYVRCLVCGSRGSRFLYRDFFPYRLAEEAAKEAWNRRVNDENA